MADLQPGSSVDEQFYSSPQSQLGKSRRRIWLGGLFGLLIALISTKASVGAFLITGGIIVVIVALIDVVLREKLAPGKALLSLSEAGITSSLLTGDNKHFPWPEILGVSLKADQGTRHLQLQLTASPERPDKRKFLNGRNDARPTILLSPFDEATQEAMLDAIRRRLHQANATPDSLPPELINELAEERQFQENLKAMAPKPWLTWLLVASNVLIWFGTLGMGASLLNTSPEQLLLWGGNAASEVQKGDWWRLLSATFLHSGLMHVTMNMIGLVAAGITVERIYGQRLYAIIYLGSGLIGSALSLHFSAQNAVSVGASGAVFGVTGALLVAVFQHRDKLPKAFGKQTISSLGFFIAYALLQGFSKTGIDNAAHVGGLLGGCLLAYLLPERFDMEHFARTAKSRALIALALTFGGTFALAALAPHAQMDQRMAINNREAFVRAMNSFYAAIQSIQQEQKDLAAGKLTERESDERSRTVHAPTFRAVLGQFDQVTLLPADPRRPLVSDVRRSTELMLELLEMPSGFTADNGKATPANPERVAIIEAELKLISERITKLSENQKKSR